MEQLDVKHTTDYGAPELKKSSKKYLALALVTAMAFHFLGVGAYWGTIYLTRENERAVSQTPTPPYGETKLPQSLAPLVAPMVSGGVRPTAGIPTPVPDVRVDSNATIPAQIDINQEPGPVDQGPTAGGAKAIQTTEEIESQPPYEVYERSPEAVKQVQPKYPDLATRSGLEGTVWVKIWVDKEGKPKKAAVLKTDSEIFNQPAIEAALQWVFTPAMMKNGPVSVWVSIPFRFKLRGK